MTTDDLDRLMGPTAKSAKFTRPGDTYSGQVVSVSVRQATEFGTGKPLVFDDGNPREQVVFIIATDLQEDPDDDGHRSVYVKGWGPQMRALRAAKATLGRNPRPGDRFTATYAGDGDRPAQGGFAPKLFEYGFVPGTEPAPSAELDRLIGPAAETASWEAAPVPTVDPAQQQARQLIATGLMTDQQVATVTGLTVGQVAGLRAMGPEAEVPF